MVDLKSFLSKKKKKSELFWTLVIEPGWVQAGIWDIKEGKTNVISIGPTTAWQTDEELVTSADTALSAAVQNLPEGEPDPEKTVFGVSSTWVSKGQIKEEFLEKLKILCSKLSLEPTGFVILPEAIAHLTKSQEGSPLNAVVVGVGNDNLEVSIFRLGNLVGTSLVARSVSLIDDIKEGLTRFSGDESFPSRFVLYNGKEGELEEVRQSLLKADWDDLEKVKFLHTPKIEIFSPDRKVLAVSLAGASEIASVSTVVSVEDKKKKETKGDEVSAKDVGFVVGQDIATVDVKEVVPEKDDDLQESAEHQETPLEKKTSTFDVKSFFTGIFPGRLVTMGRKRTLMFGGTFLVLILVAGFLYWWFAPKATVTIYVAPNRLEERMTLIVDLEAESPDLLKRELPGKLLSVSESGDKTASTTGTKTIGERAKGSVEIVNTTTDIIRLPTGTIIVAANDLEFALDSSASVSAALSTQNPGKEEVNVTAVSIGAEYNLAKEESFKIGNYHRAKVEGFAVSDLSGGSSSQISSVSEEDLDLLFEDLSEELVQKAKESMVQQISSKAFFIEESVIPASSSEDFSHKEGDEAETIKLSLSVDTTAVWVDKVSLFNLIKETLKTKIPEGYVLRENQIEFVFDLQQEKDGVYELEVDINANLLPELKLDEIAEKISGKYPPLAQSFLTTIPGFTRAQISLKPKFPGRLGVLPQIVKNINIEIAAEK